VRFALVGCREERLRHPTRERRRAARSAANGHCVAPPGVFTAIRNGQDTALADGVEQALGRPPRPFEDYVAEAAAAADCN
jgi:hypothetical protein